MDEEVKEETEKVLKGNRFTILATESEKFFASRLGGVQYLQQVRAIQKEGDH